MNRFECNCMDRVLSSIPAVSNGVCSVGLDHYCSNIGKFRIAGWLTTKRFSKQTKTERSVMLTRVSQHWVPLPPLPPAIGQPNQKQRASVEAARTRVLPTGRPALSQSRLSYRVFKRFWVVFFTLAARSDKPQCSMLTLSRRDVQSVA